MVPPTKPVTTIAVPAPCS